jgi:aryl-alcohol dehydrogenase-like predicted oxidoreductase
MARKFPQRKIGDALVSAIGLGCMGMSIIPPDRPHSDEESLQVLTEAADMGINFWVTSDFYGPFTNEKLVGRWFKETGRRNEIFLVTKFAMKVANGKREVCGKPEYVKEACEASLERLGTDRIDLYCQHRVDPDTPIEKTVEAMAELKKEGKIRYLGLSECSARTLSRAHKVHPIAAAEMEFSPFAMEIESTQTNFLKTARGLGVKIIVYSPLGRGFLTGSIKTRDDVDSMRRMHPRFSEENFSDNMKIVQALASVAKEKGCAPGQLALAWVLAQRDGETGCFLTQNARMLIRADFIPIPGTKHIKYLKENAEAINVELSEEDDGRIRKAIENCGGSKGARYPEAFMSLCFGDTPELDK